MGEISRIKTKAELKELILLLNEVFETKENSYESYYPTMINGDNLQNLIILKERGKIVAHAGFRIFDLKAGEIFFRLALIGSVATHQEFRNRGYSKTILTYINEELDSTDCDLSLLWSEKQSFYEKMGFFAGGREYCFEISCKKSDKEVYLLTQNSFKELKEVLSIYNKKESGIVRSEAVFFDLIAIPGCKLWFKEDLRGSAYAFFEKGIDFHNYIHEWGGNSEVLRDIFFHIAAFSENPVYLISPDKEVLTRIGKEIVFKNEGILGLFRINKNGHFREKSGKNLSVTFNSSEVISNKVNSCTDEELFRLIFEKGFTENLKTLKLPLFIWGLDSI